VPDWDFLFFPYTQIKGKIMAKSFCRSLFLVLCMLLWSSSQGHAQTGFSDHALTSAGAQRSYVLYLPENAGNDPLPVVFSLHGSGYVPQTQVDTSGFADLADQHGFAVIFPAGTFSDRSWNANVDTGVDDVQFIRDMIEDVAGMTSIDRSRIYASGFSGGGRMSSRVACELSDVLAAAAPVAGLQYPDDCSLRRPIPIITFHATDDPVNQYTVGEDSSLYWRMGVETALDKWRQANGCTLANTDDRLGQRVTSYRWTDCSGDSEIHFYLTDTGRHSWPGSANGNANQDINASELIWQFFSRHSLP
jgi:polyhydroxybutyrate depolymerase